LCGVPVKEQRPASNAGACTMKRAWQSGHQPALRAAGVSAYIPVTSVIPMVSSLACPAGEA
jgi:hypothetical protein